MAASRRPSSRQPRKNPMGFRGAHLRLAARLEERGTPLLANEVPFGRLGPIRRRPFFGRLQVRRHLLLEGRVQPSRRLSFYSWFAREIGDRMPRMPFDLERERLAPPGTAQKRGASGGAIRLRQGGGGTVLEPHGCPELVDADH